MEGEISVRTVGELKQFLKDIPDEAMIVMYNGLDEGDCLTESAVYYAPGVTPESGYCQGDSVIDENAENHNGTVVLFG